MSVRFVIDALDFVRKARKHRAKIWVTDLSRLQVFLYESKGEIEYQINGVIDRSGRPYLQIRIEGEIQLCCQRCLGCLPHTLSIQTSLLLVETENELTHADEDESVDVLLAAVDMDVQDLIEDEIILSLSISSRHREGECDIFDADQYKYKATEHVKPGNPNPFSALKKIKKT